MPDSPRVCYNPNYHVIKEVEIMHQIITSGGPENIQHEKILQLLTSPNNAQRQELLDKYRSKYGGADLVQALKDKLPSSEVATNNLYLALLDTPAEHDAKYLAKAMKGLGTNEDMLIEILVTRTNAQLRDIKSAYSKLFNRELDKDIAAETSGCFKTLLLDLLGADREEGNRTDPLKAKLDAERLYKAGEGKWGTDEDAFIKVLANQNLAQLQMMFNEYELVGKKHTMEQAIKAEFSGDLLNALLAIVSFVRNGPVVEVAELLHKSLTKGGKDDMLVHLVVSHSEMDMDEIANEFEKRFKVPLDHAVENSGKPSLLKHALVRMIRGNS